MLFKGILEQILLSESASVENVTRAMDNHAKVIINYHSEGKDEHTGSRVIEPVAYGLTKAGNPVIRAYQPYGDTTSSTPSWKMFRLDRISYWEETMSKFDRIPDFDMSELNQYGDKSMSTVIKTYASTLSNDATNGANVGPKTKEKVKAMAMKGDRSAEIARSNADTLKKGAIYADLDNNAKAGNVLSIKTKTDNNVGPKGVGGMYDTLGRSGSVENGDISQDELDRARQQVYGGENGYGHQFTPEEWEQIEKDMAQMNKTPGTQTTRDRRWDLSTDRMFKNRKGSANRELRDMDIEKASKYQKKNNSADDDDWFDFGNEEQNGQIN